MISCWKFSAIPVFDINMSAIRFIRRTRAPFLACLQILLLVNFANSFVLEIPLSKSYPLKFQESSLWPLHGKFRGSDDFRDVGELNKARTDIRNFLTQRAIQSFLFLLSHCRDTATVRWLEVSPWQFHQDV